MSWRASVDSPSTIENSPSESPPGPSAGSGAGLPSHSSESTPILNAARRLRARRWSGSIGRGGAGASGRAITRPSSGCSRPRPARRATFWLRRARETAASEAGRAASAWRSGCARSASEPCGVSVSARHGGRACAGRGCGAGCTQREPACIGAGREETCTRSSSPVMVGFCSTGHDCIASMPLRHDAFRSRIWSCVGTLGADNSRENPSPAAGSSSARHQPLSAVDSKLKTDLLLTRAQREGAAATWDANHEGGSQTPRVFLAALSPPDENARAVSHA